MFKVPSLSNKKKNPCIIVDEYEQLRRQAKDE